MVLQTYRDIVDKCMLEKDTITGGNKQTGLVVLSPCNNDWGATTKLLMSAAVAGVIGCVIGSRFGSKTSR